MDLPFMDPLVRPSKDDQKRARKREAQRKYRHRLRQRSEGGEENCEGSVDSDTIVIPERDGSGNETQELGQTPIGDLPLSSYVGGSEAPEHLPAVGFPSDGDTSPAVSIPHFDHYQSPPLTSDDLWPALVSGSGDGSGEGDKLLRMFGNLTNIAEGASEHVASQGDYHHFTTINTPQSDMVARQPENSQWNAPKSQTAQPSFQNLSRRSSGPFIDGSPLTRHSNKGTKKPSTNEAELCIARTIDANVDSRRRADSIVSNASSNAGWKEGHATATTNTRLAVRRIGATGVEKEQRGYTPLFQAVAQGQVKMVKILMRKCNNVNATDEMGETMLHLAAKRGNETIVDLLLESGVNLDVCDHGGNTALHLAVANGHEDIVEMLVEAGADTDIVSRPRR